MKTVGVVNAGWLTGPVDLRQLVLLFDRLAIFGSEEIPSAQSASTDLVRQWRDVRWLMERNILFEAPPLARLPTETLEKYLTDLTPVARSFGRTEWNALDRWVEAEVESDSTRELELLHLKLYRLTLQQARLLSIILRNELGEDSYPIWDDVGRALAVIGSDEGAKVMNVTLTRVPVPDAETPLEKIIDFKSDPDTRDKFRRLRLWVSQIARENYSPIEIEDRIETALHDYELHLRHAKVQFGYGTLQTIVVTAAEVLEHLAKLEFSKAARELFSIGEKRLELMSAELTAPGRELAYVAKAREQFGRE